MDDFARENNKVVQFFSWRRGVMDWASAAATSYFFLLLLTSVIFPSIAEFSTASCAPDMVKVEKEIMWGASQKFTEGELDMQGLERKRIGRH